MTPKTVIALARDPMNDTDAVLPRQSDDELMRAVNAGIKEISGLVPTLFAKIIPFDCVAGVEQLIPYTDAQGLIRVCSIHGGMALTAFDLATMDAFKPAWRLADAAAAIEWAPVPGQALGFMLNPPSANGQKLDIEVVGIPPSYTLDQVIALPDSFEPALARYVIYWAESKDDEYVNAGRSDLAYQQFLSQLKPSGV